MLRSTSISKQRNYNNSTNTGLIGKSTSSSTQLPAYNSYRSSSDSSSNWTNTTNTLRLFLSSLRLRAKLSRVSSINQSILWLIISLITIYLSISWLLDHPLILLKFKLQNSLVSSGWSGSNLSIRKSPLVFVHSSQSASVVWESDRLSTAGGNQLALLYWITNTPSKNSSISNSKSLNFEDDDDDDDTLRMATGKFPIVRRTRPEGQDGSRRWIHSCLLSHLTPGTTYAYQIVLISPNHPESHNQLSDVGFGSYQSFESSLKRVYSTHRFTWFGIDPPDITQLQQLSSTSPSSKDPIDLIHIVVLGDNQFGVKVFRRLAQRFFNIKSYAPRFKSIFGPRQILHHIYPIPKKPSLIFHLGDAVQHPHNLKQWQTDFWDPLTHKNSLSSEIPIIYSRGNHDFDHDGKNLYTGGIPDVQIGEMNRSQTSRLSSDSSLEIPGIAEADKSFTTLKIHPRDPSSRATYFSYSPHPRVRVIVCDSNLEPSRKAYPGSTMSEVDEHERWLLWEMARPEWKEASIRIIMVHVPPFVEFWDKAMWTEGHESSWGQYVRNRFAPHFHGVSTLTKRYDIPSASLVISGHSHAYSRGYLSNLVSPSYFYPDSSSSIPREVLKTSRMTNKNLMNDLNHPQADHGVVYVITGGAGGVLDTERVENWGFYERSIVNKHHFGYMMLDMSETLLSIDEWGEDWRDSRDRRKKFHDHKLRVYKLVGSQLVCKGTNDSWESGHYQATDRLIWTTVDVDGKIIDRFIIEADSCR
ncbi:Metallo-dependent phosphatase-like protein [Phakopsora pachyrhizi]|nr:Metallo-dependent phosphatase-like protein [Phakopsora pachyrhizi]